MPPDADHFTIGIEGEYRIIDPGAFVARAGRLLCMADRALMG